MSVSRYESYKDSGVEWLGEVPSHWNVLPCRAIVDERNTRNDGGTIQAYLSLMANVGIIPYEEKGDIGNKKPDDLEKCKLVFRGDLVINSMNYGIGSYGLSDLEGVCSPVYIVLSPKLGVVEERFAFRILQNRAFQTLAQSFGNGILAHRAAINWEILKVIKVAVPPKPEQLQILNFLDRETSKIDELINEQTRLIELLKEKRQAVISHAVTKGFNPDAPMKDSGVEWLGEVPEGWKLSKIKFIKASEPNAFVDGPFGSNLKSEHFTDHGDVYVIESNFATQGELDLSALKTISANHFATINRSEARCGDIIIAKIGAQFGKSSILPQIDKPAVISGNTLKLTVNNLDCVTKFAHWFLVAIKQAGALDLIVNGSAQPALSLGEMNNLPFLIPPLIEQVAIVHFLEKILSSIDSLISEAENAVLLLHERRSALISAAVTGKIDIRSLVDSKEEAA